MATMTERDKKILRLAAMGIAVYLALFFGFRAWKGLESSRVDYDKLLAGAQALKTELQPYENRLLLIEKLKERYHLDPRKLTNSTLVAEASAAIHKAAMEGRIQLGPIRESAARPSARELTSMQLEGSGPVQAVLGFVGQLDTLGFPLLIEAVTFTPEQRPGNVKVNLSIVILDYEQWMKGPVPNA